MTWVAAGVGAATAIVGGVMGSNASKKAASQQKKAAKQGMKAQKKMYEQSRKDMEPYMRSGQLANADLNMRMGLEGDKNNKDYGFLMQRFDNTKFEKDPGYQFRMDEGNRGIAATQAARGGLLSGAAAKEAARYNQGFASNEYQNAYNRFTNDQEGQYNKLSGIKASGQNAATFAASNAMDMGRSMNQNYQNLGDIKSAGTMGQSNAWQGAMSGVANAFQGGMAQRKADNYANRQYDLSNRQLTLDEKRFNARNR